MKKYVYLCGPTVYNKVHIGNMRPIVTFDLIVRGLKYLHPNNVVFIHNITDIDDKIIAQAKFEGVTEAEISQKYHHFYNTMLQAFNVQTIDVMPRVTTHIDDIAAFIEQLDQRGYVYNVNDSLYFQTGQLPTYGEIANIKLDQLNDRQDLEQANSFDFALWKNKTQGQNWQITYGAGRPGWHTECAAFVSKYAQQASLWIHGGGIDLKFPHHENENAQYQACYQKPIAKQWIHVGTLNWNKHKMSKSGGNLIYADQFLSQYQNQVNSGDLFRLLILSTSYKSTIELNNELIASLVKKMRQIEKNVNLVLINNFKPQSDHNEDQKFAQWMARGQFSKLYQLLNQRLKVANETKSLIAAGAVFNIVHFLGFTTTNQKLDPKLQTTYQAWLAALKQHDFITADQLRAILIAKRII